MLRLVVGPCLNAHKRHVRDPPPFPITLLRLLKEQQPSFSVPGECRCMPGFEVPRLHFQ
jgi:hypothetical protein